MGKTPSVTGPDRGRLHVIGDNNEDANAVRGQRPEQLRIIDSVREGNLDTRGIWTLVMFKASNFLSLSDTQLMKTVPGSFDTCF